MFDRWHAGTLKEKLARPYVHLVFGARQTGKSTLLQALLPAETLVVNLADPKERTKHLADPGAFLDLCRTLPAEKQGQSVFVDEAQAVPTIFDAVQHLYADLSRGAPEAGQTRLRHLPVFSPAAHPRPNHGAAVVLSVKNNQPQRGAEGARRGAESIPLRRVDCGQASRLRFANGRFSGCFGAICCHARCCRSIDCGALLHYGSACANMQS